MMLLVTQGNEFRAIRQSRFFLHLLINLLVKLFNNRICSILLLQLLTNLLLFQTYPCISARYWTLAMLSFPVL